jgi:cardiolipin synthase
MGDPGSPDASASLDRVATVPNLLSAIRILLIPVFVVLLLRDDRASETAGLLLLGAVVATDWVDGYIARHTGQVSNVGKLLDPVADRLAIAAALVTLAIRGAIPWWAAGLVLLRDLVILSVGVVVLVRRRVRIDVRWVGKMATFALMWGFPLIAWGSFGLWLHEPVYVIGWLLYLIGVVAYYVAAGYYAKDLRRAWRMPRPMPATGASL